MYIYMCIYIYILYIYIYLRQYMTKHVLYTLLQYTVVCFIDHYHIFYKSLIAVQSLNKSDLVIVINTISQ